VSATAAAWIAIAVALIVMSVRRPSYAIAFYMLTFFAAPHLWWWGDDLPELRYAVIAGLTLLGAVTLYLAQSPEDAGHRFTRTHALAIAMGVNATFVHFFLASVPAVSIDNYVEFLKYILLFFLMWRGIETRGDMRVVVMSIALGAAYIGYEVTINERGDFNGSRLEGVGAPGADSSNSLASVMLLVVPIVGTLFINGKLRHKLTAVAAAPLALNVLVLCNSRGAFLGLIGAAIAFLVISRGRTRKQAVRSLALGGIALYLLLGDPQILERFTTTFAGSEERDRSAASRLEFWQAGLLMLNDYPFGDGGGSFKYVHGGKYLTAVLGEDAGERSLHNGYLTEATEWGIQGLLIRLFFIGIAVVAAFRTSSLCRREGRTEDALMGTCLIVALAGFLISCMFGSFLRNEWGYWIIALLVRYGELYRIAEPVGSLVPAEDSATATAVPVAAAAAG
jgi:putative inorganic carbon (HCO3(-)) transporter